jgi:hypothetical protein
MDRLGKPKFRAHPHLGRGCAGSICGNSQPEIPPDGVDPLGRRYEGGDKVSTTGFPARNLLTELTLSTGLRGLSEDRNAFAIPRRCRSANRSPPRRR